MPGHMLDANCPCGFTGMIKVGASGPDGPDSKLLVAAYDPEKGQLISIDVEVAEQRNLTVYEDPYLFDPFKVDSEGNRIDVPKGNKATFKCPKCGKNTLRFHMFGHWD